MKTPVVCADVEDAMRAYLEDRWNSYGGVLKPTKVATTFPATLTGTQTHLQVELDGTPTVWQTGHELATVRFTFWAAPGKPSPAKAGAAITQAFVDTHPGDAAVCATTILTGRLKGIEPATKFAFASFTARVTLRPTPLT